MPTAWTCPACSSQIRHSDGDDRPRAGIVYRCHVCRLELVFDELSYKFVAAPLPDDKAPAQ